MQRRTRLRPRAKKLRMGLKLGLPDSGPIESNPPRDPDYLGWIRTLPCLTCQKYPSEFQPTEAAHTGPHAYGRKASDYSCLPLCSNDHQNSRNSYHKLGEQKFLALHQINLLQTITRLHQRYRDMYPTRRPPKIPHNLTWSSRDTAA